MGAGTVEARPKMHYSNERVPDRDATKPGLLLTLGLWRAFRQMGGRLPADDVQQITHGQIHVDQMEPPIVIALPARQNVAGNIGGSRILRIGVQ